MKKDLHILIVDDSPADAHYHKRLLKKSKQFSFEVEHISNIEKAYHTLIGPHSFDCILLDYHLGVDTGVSLIMRLRQKGVDIPIVLLTGQGNEAIAVQALKEGAEDYLSKNKLTPEDLEKSVYHAVKQVELSRQVASKQEELKRFVGIAAHDIKAPLRQLSQFGTLLQDSAGDKLTQHETKYLECMLKVSTRLGKLVDSLFEYTREGRGQQHFQKVALNQLVQQVCESLLAGTPEVVADISIAKLPIVEGDIHALFQLFQNLIGNALKFSGPAPIIHVDAKQEDGRWLFSVKDNGIGIKKQHHEKIFAPFSRLHTTSAYPGAGIGLATCKKIIEQHEGSIWVESTPNKGTTFWFTLPHTPSQHSRQSHPDAS
ncbi:MAG: hypothetical protein CL920_32555 [Deltaproteobacteria bacterium]|nr:hypothetical protein [Deltaproteobacteria bacterium]MBU53452.1 hypothetical protein [Deltaproteobacteria bacterium]|tara:strand:- start:19725 stop:20840 length:1116 start_codon:yes stop_codon:yes gene_type:complete